MAAASTLTAISLSSTAFANNAKIPVEFTCDGADQSPPLSWEGAPNKTAAFALIVEDPDAPGGTFMHWVLYDMPAATHSLPRGLPKDATLTSLGGAKQGRTSFRNLGYGGPCPPKGAPHHYHFIIFALDKMLGLQPGATRDQVMDAMRGHELARGELVGTYSRQK